jgi:hypothetical protein
MQNCPRRFGLHYSLRTNGGNHRTEVIHFKEKNGLIVRRIRLHTLSLQTNKAGAAVKPGVVVGLLVGDIQSQSPQ